jgi:pantetheine-phosphate adenylyltransferase
MKRALFPGSFDPFTIGHESIVLRGLSLFDEIIIAIGYNTSKSGFFSVDNRIKIINDIFKGNDKVTVEKYNSLTVKFCKENDINFILRGLRTASDFEYERAIAQMNHFMQDEIETVFLLTEPENTPVSSTIVREILKHNGDVCKFVPKCIDLRKYM